MSNMKKPDIKGFFNSNKEAMNTRTAQVGGYSFIVTLIVLAILILVNVAVGALPTTATQYDISSQQLYSVTSDTKVVVNNLQKDVTIYRICQSGEEDKVITRLLNVYDSMSDHVTVEEKDPDAFPTFAQQYTDGDVNNNSLVVECGDKYRYIDYADIYQADTSAYYSGYSSSASYSFDGENQITTAIAYVVADTLPQVYVLTGHGEADLSEAMTSALESSNVETQELSLLTDEIPEDCDCILEYAPTSDISDKETDMLLEYVEDGGHLLVISGPQQDDEMTNLKAVLGYYGVSFADGIVIEGSNENYAFGYQNLLLPNIESSDITDPLIDAKSNVLVETAQGMTTSSTSAGTVTSLLDTSDEAYSKVAGYDISTYDKEDGDIDGAFSVGLSIEDSENGGRIVWFSSDYMMDDTINSYSSGANTDLTMNSLSWVMNKSDTTISIRSKSLSYSYLTISDKIAKILKLWMIFIIPLCYLFLGVSEVVARRKNQ